jgi:hypothetical protein
MFPDHDLRGDTMEEQLDKLATQVTQASPSLTWARVRDSSNTKTRHMRIENVSSFAVTEICAYRPVVFIVISCDEVSSGVVESRFLTYNEEVIETCTFALDSETDLVALRRYVVDRLGRTAFVSCPGLPEERWLELVVNSSSSGQDASGRLCPPVGGLLENVTLVEKVGENVRYRSRHCARVRTTAEAEGKDSAKIISEVPSSVGSVDADEKSKKLHKKIILSKASCSLWRAGGFSWSPWSPSWRAEEIFLFKNLFILQS